MGNATFPPTTTKMIGLLSTALGLYQGAQQNRASNAMAREGLDLQRRQAALAEEDYYRRQREFDRMEQQGAFNPDAQVQNLRDSFANAGRIEQGNLATAARVAGYRPGDSALQNAVRRASERARIQLAGQEAQVRDNALRTRMAALGMTAPNTQTGMAVGSNLVNYAEATRPNLGGLAQGIAGNQGLQSEFDRVFKNADKRLGF